MVERPDQTGGAEHEALDREEPGEHADGGVRLEIVTGRLQGVLPYAVLGERHDLPVPGGGRDPVAGPQPLQERSGAVEVDGPPPGVPVGQGGVVDGFLAGGPVHRLLHGELPGAQAVGVAPVQRAGGTGPGRAVVLVPPAVGGEPPGEREPAGRSRGQGQQEQQDARAPRRSRVPRCRRPRWCRRRPRSHRPPPSRPASVLRDPEHNEGGRQRDGARDFRVPAVTAPLRLRVSLESCRVPRPGEIGRHP